jgi:hypothetical protein
MNKKVTFQLPPLGRQYAQQSINKQQNVAKNPVTKAMASDQIVKMINQSGMPPSMLAHIGQLAEQAINDPKKYPEFVNFMVSKKLETAEELKKPDYQMLGMMVVIGKVAQTMPDNQQKIGEQIQPVSPTEGL